MQHITDLWQHIQHLVITQYRDSTNLLSLLRKVFSGFRIWRIVRSGFPTSRTSTRRKVNGSTLSESSVTFRDTPARRTKCTRRVSRFHSRRTPQERQTTSSKMPATFRATQTHISLTNVPPFFSSIHRVADSYDAEYFKCWRLLAFSRSLLRD